MAKRSRDDSLSVFPDLEAVEDGEDRAVTKYKHTDEASDELTEQTGLMRCTLPPHKPLVFSTYDDYDSHYEQTHVHRCSQCHKNFPSPHFTNIHIAENHDPFNEAKKARGIKIYDCFVEDCDKVCSTPQKRRMHLVDKHHFPKNYNFFIVNDGLDRRKSMLRPPLQHRRRPSLLKSELADASSSSTKSAQASDKSRDMGLAPDDPDEETDADSHGDSQEREDKSSPVPRGGGQASNTATTNVEDEVENITKSMSALKFVPPSVRFGRGRGRGFPKRGS